MTAEAPIKTAALEIEGLDGRQWFARGGDAGRLNQHQPGRDNREAPVEPAARAAASALSSPTRARPLKASPLGRPGSFDHKWIYFHGDDRTRPQ